MADPLRLRPNQNGGDVLRAGVGHRVGGSTVTREFPYHVGKDGRLIDLSEGPPSTIWIG